MKSPKGIWMQEWTFSDQRDEIGQLGASFNKMAAKLGQYINDHGQAEEALRASEEKYRALFEESKDTIYISTPEGRFTDINSAGIKLLGYASKEEILGIDIPRDLYVNTDDRAKFIQAVEEKGFVEDFEVQFRRRDGEVLDILLSASAVRNDEGRIVAYRGMMRDVTERRKLQHQLLQSQKMEAVGQLAGGVAHDFNNILTAIIGYGNLVLMKTNADDPLRFEVRRILTSAERGAALTQNLLAFSRKQIIHPEPIRINGIILSMGAILVSLIREDIELQFDLGAEDMTIMADKGQIEQVLMNLATNARDAMPKGGSLRISLEKVDMDRHFLSSRGYGKAGRYVVITVQDTGIGMDEQTKTKIFEPFFTTKEVGKGTGLGLAMVYSIIQQHNGYITVHSEPNVGMTVRMYLPLVSGEEDKGTTEQSEAIRGGSETILLAEDEAVVREIHKSILEEFGYRVIEALDGEDALNKFSIDKEHFDLLVLDVIMPKMNGKEVCEEIRKSQPDMRAIFMSGHPRDLIQKQGVLKDEEHFLAKPATPQNLLKKIRTVLDSETRPQLRG